MPLLESTYRNQSALASYCRTGNYRPIKGINKKNITQYRRLVFSIVDDMLTSAFPLAYGLVSNREWASLTKDFFSNHPCSSPQVWHMPKEFYHYLSTIRHPLLAKYPFLLELLWFEWLEIDLYMMADKIVPYNSIGDISTDALVLNPESHFQHFNYPVHLKNAKKITKADHSNYYLTIHRLPETGSVSFTNLSPALLRMLEILANQPCTVTALSQQVCSELGITYTDDILKTTTSFIQESLQSQLIIGFAPN